MCVYTREHVAFPHVHVHVHIRIHGCIRTCMHTYIHAYIHAHFKDKHTKADIHVCIHQYTNIIMHTHTHPIIQRKSVEQSQSRKLLPRNRQRMDARCLRLILSLLSTYKSSVFSTRIPCSCSACAVYILLLFGRQKDMEPQKW
jgi:hypothetical protein